MTSNAKVVSGILTGALLGASLAILFAPDSGRHTRTKITDGSRRMMDAATEGLDRAGRMLGLGERKPKQLKKRTKA